MVIEIIQCFFPSLQSFAKGISLRNNNMYRIHFSQYIRIGWVLEDIYNLLHEYLLIENDILQPMDFLSCLFIIFVILTIKFYIVYCWIDYKKETFLLSL
mgnify:CR=1 FL=1